MHKEIGRRVRHFDRHLQASQPVSAAHEVIDKNKIRASRTKFIRPSRTLIGPHNDFNFEIQKYSFKLRQNLGSALNNDGSHVSIVRGGPPHHKAPSFWHISPNLERLWGRRILAVNRGNIYEM
jgi:hypothetical protein